MSQRVLVTGSEGYIGSVLMPLLDRCGYAVTGLDAGWFAESEFVPIRRHWRSRRQDVRDVELHDLRGFDSVVHLAGLSNDPLGELDAERTLEINYAASARLARLAKQAGVKRFIFSSSCSVYGKSDDEIVDESSAPNPQTAYARSKLLTELQLESLCDDRFSTVSLRNATAFGVSPRQRLDLVVSDLVSRAYLHGEIGLLSDGTPWRPLVHIRDIARAIVGCLSVPKINMHAQTINIGRCDHNYRIREIAEHARDAVPGSTVSCRPQLEADQRSYRVCFAKAQRLLGRWMPRRSLQHGIREYLRAFHRIEFDANTYGDRLYTRLAQIKFLTDRQLLDNEFRWNAGCRHDSPNRGTASSLIHALRLGSGTSL